LLKAKAKAKDSKFVLGDTSRPRTKAKDNNTAPPSPFGYYYSARELILILLSHGG